MMCGVSQGSFLWPLLFLFYVNDTQYSLDKSSFYLFAYDTNILYADHDKNKISWNCCKLWTL